MVPFNSFLNHFNFPKIWGGYRNFFNRKKHSLSYKIVSVLLWVLLLPLKILDLLGFFYLIDFLRSFFIKKRRLTKFEIEELKLVFGECLNWSAIKINENSYFARVGARSIKKSHLGFVLFNTINFTRPLNCEKSSVDMGWLIHEVVHVVQFKHLGVQYIIEALRAQKNGGYNYGGIRQLQNSKRLSEFNLEQQADIARHYYKYLKSNSNYKNLYQPFVDEIRRGRF